MVFFKKIFEGPLHLQLRAALTYIDNILFCEEVRKLPNQAEALRFYNYPFVALQESLSNAVYHKDYEKKEPIEVRIHADKIEILSYPGPSSFITKNDLNRGRIIAREYRNRRVGDFLKELHLTRGRCVGIPKIQRVMKANGSPPAIFDMDDGHSYFMTTLPIHPLV